MGIFDKVEGIVKRQMVLFSVVDTSGSMIGTKIGSVNTAIREVLPELKGIGGSDVDLKITCLKFSSGCSWMHPSPVPVENFQWNNLSADGVTDFGAACKELSDKMAKEKFMSAPSASVAPAIFLMSDGEPTDDYKSGLAALQQNNWYKYAIKVAVAIGDGLCVVLEDEESIITTIKNDGRLAFSKTTSLCDNDAIKNFRESFGFTKINGLTVATDGIADSFEPEKYLQFNKELYDNFTEIPDKAGAELEAFLPELSERGSRDDVSIAEIFRMKGKSYRGGL
jgi:uncharacterized protein YegL